MLQSKNKDFPSSVRDIGTSNGAWTPAAIRLLVEFSQRSATATCSEWTLKCAYLNCFKLQATPITKTWVVYSVHLLFFLSWKVYLCPGGTLVCSVKVLRTKFLRYHRKVWVRRHLQRSSSITSLPWAWESFTRSGCSCWLVLAMEMLINVTHKVCVQMPFPDWNKKEKKWIK